MKPPSTLSAMVRQSLDCNQQQLADYLEVSRAMISVVEINKRTLPPEASLRLFELYQLIAQAPKPELPAASDPVSSYAIDDYIFKMKQQLTNQRKVYDNFVANRQAASNALHLVAWLREQTMPGSQSLVLFLNMLEAEAKHKLSLFSEDKLALEDLKLRALEASTRIIGL